MTIQYRAALRQAVRRADAIITVSRHTAEDLARRTRVDHRRVHVTPLAASLPTESTDPGPVLDRLKIPPPYLLFVGTLEPRKNLLRLLRAYRAPRGGGAPARPRPGRPDGLAPAAAAPRGLGHGAPARSC